MTPAAVVFHADAVETPGKDLVGRRSAGQSFLRGWLTHAAGDRLCALTETAKAAETLRALAEEMRIARPLDIRTIAAGDAFTDLGTIFFPGPGYLDCAWLRQRTGASACSLVGITHTVSTRRVLSGLNRLLSEPVQPWDAVICTSPAVQRTVATQLEASRRYLSDRFGTDRVPMPQLPVIPLGIHAGDFAPRAGARDLMRARYGAGEAFVVMSMGRITSVEKANPVPLYMALEAVAQALGRPVHLWQVGWANRDEEETLHREGAAAICPSVRVTRIDGRAAEVRRDIWAGADVFTLPVDNVQETFGLVPVEAMAAGLPVVMPDWDGFRATIRHGETGLLIPTRMPAPGGAIGPELAARYADGRDGYLAHLALLQQQTEVDVPAYTQALLSLAEDPGLRARMGAAGRGHVAARLDWSAVIPRYQTLADRLAELREGTPPALGPMPLQIDPFTLYAGYPSEPVTPDWTFTAIGTLDEAGLRALDGLNGRTLYNRKQTADGRVVELLRAGARTGPAPIADLARRIGMRPDIATGTALFVAKYGYAQLTPPRSE